jgi:hypothetical protein
MKSLPTTVDNAGSNVYDAQIDCYYTVYRMTLGLSNELLLQTEAQSAAEITYICLTCFFCYLMTQYELRKLHSEDRQL